MPSYLHSTVYDFIIVGAGPAGCALASALAASPAAPTVLLVEAGDNNQDENLRIDANKYVQHQNPTQAWGYTSAPEPSLGDRVLELARGKGLGGSSAVNFTVWSEGSRDDMDSMVKFTGDDSWGWDKVKERYRRLTTYNMDIHQDYKPYIEPNVADVGKQGQLRIGYPAVYDPEITGLVDVFLDNGVSIRKNANDGNPLGIAIYPVTSHRGRRSTSADLLHSSSQNLVVLTNCTIHRVLFEGRTATGIITHHGQTIHARKEVILSSGAMDSPKILMHSGIGPADQLATFGIPVLFANPNVGQNFQDHVGVVLRWQRAEHTSIKPEFFRDKKAQSAALTEWKQFGTGPLASIGCTNALGFFKSDAVLASTEFSRLPAQQQAHMTAPTMPMYEVALGATAPEYYLDPDNAPAIATAFVILHNLQSRGSCRLQSADPSVPLVFNTSFLSHPFDQRLAIESMKEIMHLMQSEAFQKDHVRTLIGPKSITDEDILEFWRNNANTAWHMSSTCSMTGVENEDGNTEGGVVDRDFRVHGTTGLRVVDNSIFPFIPSAHIQAHAYQVGLIAAEKIIRQHELD
ncbi:hypothetical protein NQ176_g346 [Zarea fungicola]|uniref:Uncharacterized protein n=1 Tax=Zarea fungicola TaxID=93591 RepID=A0ACC1NXN8_9HYPO|nr:hypothetical protein NQ176_g346 [Lecanicillium fungicola]